VLLFAAVKVAGAPTEGFYAVVVLPLLVPLAVGMALPALDAWRTARGTVAKGIMVLSILSYAMFMVNLIMAELVDCRMTAFAAGHGVAAYVLFWAMVVAGTAVLYYVVERPAMLVRQRVKSRELRVKK
jgi:peptidoglycan/LPS O-acetylase OafA/YrhL